jgi:uncharacterized protein (DUF1697 family)
VVKYVALLRGINVGGNAILPMAEVRAFFEGMGVGEVKTLLQSGNVVFSGKVADGAALEKKLEAAAKKKFGREIGFFVRDAAERKGIVAGNPFADEAKRDPGRLVVMCLKAAPKKGALAALKAAIVGRETFRAGEGCLYIYYPDGQGTSKFTNALIERKLGTNGTARNWNTVLKIAAMLEGDPD